ncbi:MAG: NAD(+)/NADH kinase [Syntrophales bacterium]
MKKIGIVANADKEKAPDYTILLRDWLIARGLDVFLDEAIAKRIGNDIGFETDSLAAQVELIVVFGGDGTILRTARSVREHEIPIVGINMGGFGYLTEINLNEMFSTMEKILHGDFQTDKRMMLDVSIKRDRGPIVERTVLNDAVINRGNLSRIVELETAIDDHHLTTFRADGMIISTPTGSTAYSLSAGGPIVFPQQECLILNPICPHTLTNRPIILPESGAVRIVLWTREHGATLTLDGQVSYTLKSGDTIIVKKSKYVTTLVTSPDRDYMEILRTKLGWSGQPSGTVHPESL